MLFFQYCNRYDGNHTFDQNLRIGLVRELILQVTVTNKANDHAYYPKLLVKYPRSLGYLRTGDVSRLKITDVYIIVKCENAQKFRNSFLLYSLISCARNPYFLGSIFLQDMMIYSHSNHFNMSFSPRPNVELFMGRTKLSSWKVWRLAQLSSSEWVWIVQHVLSVCFRRKPSPGMSIFTSDELK